jgi:hypothetical protein
MPEATQPAPLPPAPTRVSTCTDPGCTAPWCGVTLTPEQIASVLALHRQWRVTDTREGARAVLCDADLCGADLCGADLCDAVLRGADLRGAVLGRTLQRIGPIDGWTMVSVRWDDGPRIACGCRWFTIAEAREHWGPGCAPRRAHGDLMLAGLDALVAICRAHGWPGCEVTR